MWFHREWYAYLFAPLTWRNDGWLRTVWCRLRGHPSGPIFYNVGGTEPDPHCKDCGDAIG